MKMKRLLACLLCALMVLSLAACGGNSGGSSDAGASNAGSSDAGASDAGASNAAPSGTVHLWATGSDNVRQVFETLVETFNAQSDSVQVELNFMLSGTGTQTMVDMLAAAYKSGQTNTDYDLIDLGGDDFSRLLSLIGTEAFLTLDSAKMPNAASVDAEPAEGADILQPYRGTTVVLAYNSETVPTPPKTLDELVAWMEANPGRFAYNVPGTGGAGDAFVRTAVYNYIEDAEAWSSDDEKWMEQWDSGFEFLASIHPYMYTSGGTVAYPNKNQGALDLLSNKEIDMCPMWADMLLSQRSAGTVPQCMKMTTITPSFTGSLQGMAIPTFGSNTEGAYEFINYMLSAEAQQILVEKMAAIPLIDTSEMNLDGVEDLADLDVTQFRTLSIGSLDTYFNERWDNEISTLG